jgi:hypothetical protein
MLRSLRYPSVVLLTVLVACSAATKRSGFDDPAAQTDAGAGEGGGSSSGVSLIETDSAGPGECFANSNPNDTSDNDGDGFSVASGDCNDCNANVNPGAFDSQGDLVDNDCNGKVDDPVECDDGIAERTTDAYDAARAIGLCKKATDSDKSWGVISAKYILPDGKSNPDNDGFAIRPDFGVNNPQQGKRMLALSSGIAWGSEHEGDKNQTHGVPKGYAIKESPACKDVTTGQPHDGAALELKIRVPLNAKSFSFQQNFFTEEFPAFICSRFNDRFVATLDPLIPGLPDGNNVAFDQDGNPISVNNSLLQVCKPQVAGSDPPLGGGKKNFTCPLGVAGLSGTSFQGHAATGWLQTTVPFSAGDGGAQIIKGGDIITLTFAIWDSGDGILDSTVLIDKFEWSTDDKPVTKTEPVVPK